MSLRTNRDRRILEVERAVRRVRWLAAGFAIVQFALFEPPSDVPLPFPRWPVAALFVIVLVAVNLVSYRVEAFGDIERMRRFGYVGLAIDLGLASALTVLFGFDPTTRMWPILTFPVLEGAMRGAFAGAMWTWAGGSLVYVVEQVVRLPSRDDPGAWIGSIPWGVGILLLVAAASGMLARRLQEVSDSHDREEDRLRRLAAFSRAMSAERDMDAVFDQLIDATRSLTGIDHVALYEYAGAGQWIRRGYHGTVATDVGRVEPVPEFSRLVESMNGPAPIDLDGPMGERSRRMVPGIVAAFGAPLMYEDRVLGLLLLGTPHAEEADVIDEIAPILTLLTAHAAVAIDNARLAEAEERTIEELRELDRMKDDFVSILTHELRTPMASMLGAAELLDAGRDRFDSARRAELVGMMRRGATRLNQLIQDVYDAMQAERLELPVDLVPVDLVPLTLDIAEEELAASRRHELVLDVDPDLPPVEADEQRVGQVLHNLLSNAVKYSPAGGAVTVRLRRDGDHAALSISDQGLGIPRAARDRLFGKFQRLHGEHRIKGTGLGLYLVRALVHAMGGQILVDSTEGEGSTFTVRLRFASSRPAQSTDEGRSGAA